MNVQTPKPIRAGIMAAVASAILMGTIGVISRQTGLAAETVTFFRLGFGALFMLFFLLGSSQIRLITCRPSWTVLVNGAMLAGFIVCYIQAMNFTTMTNAIMLVYLAPLVAAGAAHLFLNEPLSRRGLFYTGLALFGFMMVLEFRVDFSSDPQGARGLGYGLLAMAAYAAFILNNRRTTPAVHPYTSTFFQLLTGALVILPFALGKPWDLSSAQWAWLVVAGLFPGFLAILLAVVALRNLRAATFGTLAYFEPLAVVIFGAVLFGELLSPLQTAGCVLIFAGGIAAARS